MCWKTSLIYGGSNSQFMVLKGSAPYILLPDTRAHRQGSSEVHALTSQGCFGNKESSKTILIRWPPDDC